MLDLLLGWLVLTGGLILVADAVLLGRCLWLRGEAERAQADTHRRFNILMRRMTDAHLDEAAAETAIRLLLHDARTRADDT